MKIIYFVNNGRASDEDVLKARHLRDQGNKVYFSNGSCTYGFQDSCDAVVLAGDFTHVKSWAESTGIKIIEDKQESEEKPRRTRRKVEEE